MKRLTNYLFIALAVVSMVFTSCEDEDPLGPNIKFFGGEYIDGDATIKAGETASFSWQAEAGDANLVEFTIRINNEDVKGFPNTDIDKNMYGDTWDTTLVTPGVYSFTFIIEDKDGMTDSKTITVTAESDLVSQGEANLGAGSSSLGSYYSLADGAVMTLAEAKANPAKVDIVFSSTASEAVFKSPKDAAAGELQAENRTTLFASTTLDFETATSAEIAAVSLTNDNITLASGDVIVIETEDGDRALLQVNSLAVAADGTVTIDVKVKG